LITSRRFAAVVVAGGSAETVRSSDAAAAAASSEASEARLKCLRLTAGGVAVSMMMFSFDVAGIGRGEASARLA
jgi:hypothetical protein